MVSQVENEDELLNLVDALGQFEREFHLGNRFNLFEALNMTRQEIRHSRFLAFLLNPVESHGLGERFLRSLLMAAATDHPFAPVSRLDLAIGDLSDATVHCERDHFDITVQVPELSLMFVIENKIGAGERPDQLLDYRRKVTSRYAGYKFMGCFLTPDGYDGEDDNWGSMSYSTIASELKRVSDESPLSDDVALVIQHYVELVERKIVASDALIEACRKIYRQHRTALDLIAEHGQESVLGLAFSQFKEEHGELQSSLLRSNTVRFLDSSWLQIADHPKPAKPEPNRLK